MLQIEGVISFLDSRSFGTIWFWIVVLGMWSAVGRHVLGVPTEVLLRARRARRDGRPDGAEAITLLDWLSLTLPRWQPGRGEGAVILGLSLFALSSLAILGFGYWLEMAQALTLLLTPFAALFWLRVWLAGRLHGLLGQAQSDARPLAQVAGDIIGRMMTHRRLVSLLSIVSVAATALWGTLWMLMHPFGF